MKKYNLLRNLIEHEYVTPSYAEAENVADVADLFLKATLCYSQPLPDNLTIVPRDGKGGCTIVCNWDEKQITIVCSVEGVSEFGTCIIEAEKDQDLWMVWVAKILSLMQDYQNPYTRCKDIQQNPGQE